MNSLVLATLLLLPFENASKDKANEALQHQVPDLLTAYLSPQSDRLQIVDREQMENLAQEAGLHWQGYMAQKNLTSIGTLAQAKYILRGSYSMEGKQLSVRSFLYETETTRLVKSFEAKGGDAPAVCRSMASLIAAFFTSDRKSLPELAPDENPEVNTHLIYGLGYYHCGRFEKAFPEFMLILEKDPNHELARYWLAKSYYAAGMKEAAAIEFERTLTLFPKSNNAAEIKSLLVESKK